MTDRWIKKLWDDVEINKSFAALECGHVVTRVFGDRFPETGRIECELCTEIDAVKAKAEAEAEAKAKIETLDLVDP